MGITYKDICDIIKNVMKTSEFVDAQNRYIALNTNINNAVYKIDAPLEFQNLGLYSIEFSNIYYSIFYEINGIQNYVFNLNVDTSFFNLNRFFETESEYDLLTYKITIKSINKNIAQLNMTNYNIGKIVLENGLIFNSITFKMNEFMSISSNDDSLACLDLLDEDILFDNSIPSNIDYYYFYNIYDSCTFKLSSLLTIFRPYIIYEDETYLKILLDKKCKIRLDRIELEFTSEYVYLLSKYKKLFSNLNNIDNNFIFIVEYNPGINALFELYDNCTEILKFFNIKFFILDTLIDYNNIILSINELRNKNIFKNIFIEKVNYTELMDRESMLYSSSGYRGV